MKNYFLQFLASITFLLLTAGGAYADEAGRVVLVVGDVQIAGQRVVTGRVVREGDELSTSSDGYAYLKTVDDGFLILRPNTRARIVAYHVDSEIASNTRVKFELLYGVARSISGKAVKKARQNFRFNTPVAAIGVRGTDFTVFTDQQSTRITVNSGAVIASGFSATCGSAGSGPCEGSSSLELSANQTGKLLQIMRGQKMPQLLRSNSLSPDKSAPPRSDEPTSKNAEKSKLAVNDVNLEAQKGSILNVTQSVITPVLLPPPPVRQIVWGRWQEILNQPGTIDLTKALLAQGQLLAVSSYFAILRTNGVDWQMPNQGIMGFTLAQSDALILNESSGVLSRAGMENAQLRFDFGNSTFSTGFDLVSQQNERFQFQSQGHVMPDGVMVGNNQYLAPPTNMYIKGVVDPVNGGNASYLFQGRIDNNRLATGVTAWAKK